MLDRTRAAVSPQRALSGAAVGNMGVYSPVRYQRASSAGKLRQVCNLAVSLDGERDARPFNIPRHSELAHLDFEEVTLLVDPRLSITAALYTGPYVADCEAVWRSISARSATSS